MISVIFYAAILAMVLAQSDPDIFSCIKETNVNARTIQAQMSGFIFPEQLDEFNTFAACYCRKKGYLKKDGEVDWENINRVLLKDLKHKFSNDWNFSKHLTEEKVKESVKSCRNRNILGDNVGQKAVKIRNCIVTKLKSVED